MLGEGTGAMDIIRIPRLVDALQRGMCAVPR